MVEGPDGPVEVMVTGSGEPVTVFAHGLASSIAETRPFGSAVTGTRVFLHFRGHGASAAPQTPWTYPALEDELWSVIDAYDARRGLGVSLGAGALLRAAAHRPARFDRLVFVLPSTLDTPRLDPAVERMRTRAALVEAGDIDGLTESLVAEQPSAMQEWGDVRVWARRQAERLSATEVARALRELPSQHPLESREQLAAIDCPVLVVGQEGDAAHPAQTARELAAALPDARVEIFGGGGVLWSHRAEVRRLISTYLNRP
ncbi:MAG: alpha/beta fold hydrolase [Nocardioidaceae bacterium]